MSHFDYQTFLAERVRVILFLERETVPDALLDHAKEHGVYLNDAVGDLVQFDPLIHYPVSSMYGASMAKVLEPSVYITREAGTDDEYTQVYVRALVERV